VTYKPVDAAIVMVVGPCIDDTDFKSLEESIAYDAAGMDVSLVVEKTDGTTAVTGITLTTGGANDWGHTDGGYYYVEITAAQNVEEGVGFIRGVCDGVLPFESPHYNIVVGNIYDSWIKGTDKLQVDAVEISGDSTAADNCELDYDGTGYAKANSTIGTCTANTDLVSAAAIVNEWESQSQADPTGFHVNVLEIGGTAQTANDNGADINSIVTAVVPTTHCSTSGTVNTGSVSSGTHSDTCTDDTSYWTIIESGGTINVELGFGIGVNRVPTNVSCVLRSPSSGGTLIFYAYNYLTSAWDKLNYATFEIPSLTDTDYRFSMLQDHVDVDGNVIIRVVSTGYSTSETLEFDLVNVRSINAGSIANGVKLGAQGQSDVNAECDTALVDYDPPTNTEMEARTIVAADYVVVGDTIAGVTAAGSVTGAVGSVTGNVGGNVTGSVGSVVGAVGSVTGSTGSVTGNVGGNVTGSVGSVVGAVGSVTGNVGGNVTGSVGSLVGHTVQTGDSYAVVNHVDYGNSKLVRSTTPANSLDVSATGEAGIDFNNIKDATLAHTLTNVTVPTVTTTTTATNLTNAPTSGDLTATMKASVNTEADSALTDYDAPTNTEMEARTIAAADYVVTTDTIAGVTTATNLTNAPTSGDFTATMKASVNTEVVDVLTIDTIADSYATDGNQPTIAQAILAIQQMMQEKSITGTTLLVKKPDGSTSAMTFTLDSATTPTSITRAT